MPRKIRPSTTPAVRKPATKVVAKAASKAAKQVVKKAPPATAEPAPFLRTADLQEIVRDLGARVAQRDIEQLLLEERQLRAQAQALKEPQYALLRQQLPLALDILRDHVDGECPQIPLSTIAILGAAVGYYDHSVDVIPDFLPNIGRLDDAAVMAVAFQLGEAGIRRYCDWKSRPLPTVLVARRR